MVSGAGVGGWFGEDDVDVTLANAVDGRGESGEYGERRSDVFD